MRKTILLTLVGLVMMAVGVSAQTLKFGHFDSGKFMNDLPDIKKVNETLNGEMSKVESQLAMLNEDYQKRATELNQKAKSMSKEQLSASAQELAEMEQRIETFRKTSMEDLRKKQQELVQPIMMKVRKAVEEVGANGGFIYIVEASGAVCGPKSEDVTPLVRKKLGL